MNVERIGRWLWRRRSAIATMLILASIAGLIQTTGPGPISGPTAVVEPSENAELLRFRLTGTDTGDSWEREKRNGSPGLVASERAALIHRFH